MQVLYAIPTNPPPTVAHPEQRTKEFNRFLARCLEKDSTKRPSAEDLLEDEFITKNQNLHVLKDLVVEVLRIRNTEGMSASPSASNRNLRVNLDKKYELKGSSDLNLDIDNEKEQENKNQQVLKEMDEYDKIGRSDKPNASKNNNNNNNKASKKMIMELDIDQSKLTVEQRELIHRIQDTFEVDMDGKVSIRKNPKSSKSRPFKPKNVQPPRSLRQKPEPPLVGSSVWIPHPSDGFTIASVQSTSSKQAKVVDNFGKEFTVPLTDIIRIFDFQLDKQIDDLVQLGDLTEPTILFNLRKRYEQNIIYTKVGTILISVNPYKNLPIYGPEQIKKYHNQNVSDLPPHAYCK